MWLRPGGRLEGGGEGGEEGGLGEMVGVGGGVVGERREVKLTNSI